MSQILKPKKGYKKVKWLFRKEIEIPSAWDITSIGQISKKLLSGGTPDTKNEEYWNGDIPWTRGAMLTEHYISEGEAKITKEGYKNSSSIIIKKNNLIISSRVSLGNISINRIDIAINQDATGIILDKSKASEEYLYWLLLEQMYRLTTISQGTSIQGFIRKDLERLKIPLPPLDEQQKIASILSNVDAQIQQTQKLVDLTQRLKKGLMQKLLTRGIGHTKFKKVPWYFQKEIEIPEEWEVKRIVNTGDFINGLNKKKEDYGHGCLHVNIDNIFESFVIDPTKVGRVNATNDEITTYNLQDGDICLLRSSVKREGIGYPALFLKNNKPVVFSGFIIRFRPNQKVWNSFFLTFLLRTEIMRKLVISRSTSSANTNINQPSYGSIQICIPPLPEQQKITTILSNVDSKIQSKEQYKEKLQRLKKSLMQKLLTGQVRVAV